MTQTASDSTQPSQPNDWSHLRETINMLYLAVCQIEATLTDSNASVDTLTSSFTKLYEHSSEVTAQIKNLDRPEQLEKCKADLMATATEMQANIFGSVQAFQFYDRVCQRLDHVARSLEKVSNLMDDEAKVFDPQNWRNVQTEIKSSYTMEAERIMFEYIMRGGTVKEALDIYKHYFDNREPDENNDDEIEIF